MRQYAAPFVLLVFAAAIPLVPTARGMERQIDRNPRLFFTPERIEQLKQRIESNPRIADVWLNLMADGRRMHRNSNNIIDGWDTDAYLIALTQPVQMAEANPDSITRYFVACGSYLRKDDRVVFDSLSKVYAVFTCREPRMQVALQGQPLIRASIRATRKPLSVELNGDSVAPVYDTRTRMLRLTCGSPR